MKFSVCQFSLIAVVASTLAAAQSLNSLIQKIDSSCYGTCLTSVLQKVCPDNPTWACFCADNSYSDGYNAVLDSPDCYTAAANCGKADLIHVVEPLLIKICTDENSGGGSPSPSHAPAKVPAGANPTHTPSNHGTKAVAVGWALALPFGFAALL